MGFLDSIIELIQKLLNLRPSHGDNPIRQLPFRNLRFAIRQKVAMLAARNQNRRAQAAYAKRMQATQQAQFQKRNKVLGAKMRAKPPIRKRLF